MDVALLSRVQFAMTVGFHYIYPPLSIGLGLLLVIMEGMYLRTKDRVYEKMTIFWIRIFALIFGLGVATGIVMEFEFGTNWAAYSRFVGDVFGSALAAEGIFAFFLESGFLAVLVFGRERVSPKMHFFSAIMVALGAHLSALWIIVANSWQQTPAGYHIVNNAGYARAEITDFWAMVFNPSSMDRFTHAVSAAWITGAFLVLSVSAYYLLKKRHHEFALKSMKIASIIAIAAGMIQVLTGHSSAQGVAANQPAKLAAFEGHYNTGPGDLYLFGWVNEADRTAVGVKLPGMLSWLVHFDASKPVTGLNEFNPGDRPPVNIVFQSYHAMVGIGMILLLLAVLACFIGFRGKAKVNKILLQCLVASAILPQLANQLGWISAEVGRQPWIVYNLLRTADALSKAVNAGQVWFSLILFTLIYTFLFVLFIYLLNKKIKAGPGEIEIIDEARKEIAIEGK